MDLPPEIRDEIYSLIFVRKSRFPIDFASCADCVHKRFVYMSERLHDPDEHYASIEWQATE